MDAPGAWMAAAFLALVIGVGVWSLLRHWSQAIQVERRRSQALRQGLVNAATLASAAKNVRCPTCLTNWGSIHNLCELAIVSGDAVGTSKEPPS